jgi:hypothetical protein
MPITGQIGLIRANKEYSKRLKSDSKIIFIEKYFKLIIFIYSISMGSI